jgi:hypothetical protein
MHEAVTRPTETTIPPVKAILDRDFYLKDPSIGHPMLIQSQVGWTMAKNNSGISLLVIITPTMAQQYSIFKMFNCSFKFFFSPVFINSVLSLYQDPRGGDESEQGSKREHDFHNKDRHTDQPSCHTAATAGYSL